MISMIGTADKIIQFLFNQERSKIFEIKEKKAKRSLSQNSYAWKLITEIANVMRSSKEEVYMDMLRNYGQSDELMMLSSVAPDGYFKYYDILSKRKVGENEFTVYRVYKGSSEYDTKEMTIFIDGIIQECHSLGIETMTPEEIARLDL